MKLRVAVWVQQHQVAESIRTTARTLYHVMQMPPRVSRDPLIAVRACPVLPPPQPTQLPTSFEHFIHLAGEPLEEILVERRIVRICRCVDLGVRPFPELTQGRQQLVLSAKRQFRPLWHRK